MMVLAAALQFCEGQELISRRVLANIAQDLFSEVDRCHSTISGVDESPEEGADYLAFSHEVQSYVDELLRLHNDWYASHRGRSPQS